MVPGWELFGELQNGMEIVSLLLPWPSEEIIVPWPDNSGGRIESYVSQSEDSTIAVPPMASVPPSAILFLVCLFQDFLGFSLASWPPAKSAVVWEYVPSYAIFPSKNLWCNKLSRVSVYDLDGFSFQLAFLASCSLVMVPTLPIHHRSSFIYSFPFIVSLGRNVRGASLGARCLLLLSVYRQNKEESLSTLTEVWRIGKM